MKIPMLTNSSGKSSASFTMLFLAFNVILLWLLLSIIGPTIGMKAIPAFSGSDSMLLLSPLLTNYFFGKKQESEKKEE